jgi:hypothetical protein
MKLEPDERWGGPILTTFWWRRRIIKETKKRFADCKQNLYKDEIINSCAHLIENSAESLSGIKNYSPADVYLILMDVAKSIRALAK